MKASSAVIVLAALLSLAAFSGLLVLSKWNRAKTSEGPGVQLDEFASGGGHLKRFSGASGDNIIQKVKVRDTPLESQEYWAGFETIDTVFIMDWEKETINTVFIMDWRKDRKRPKDPLNLLRLIFISGSTGNSAEIESCMVDGNSVFERIEYDKDSFEIREAFKAFEPVNPMSTGIEYA